MRARFDSCGGWRAGWGCAPEPRSITGPFMSGPLVSWPPPHPVATAEVVPRGVARTGCLAHALLCGVPDSQGPSDPSDW